MLIGICGDIHWSTYSSILRSRGKNFSTRLENLILSLSWVESLFKEKGCEEEIFLGDTFDRPDINSEEISALSEVEWNKTTRLKHFLVGNHESGVASLVYNSTQVLHKLGSIEDTPYIYPLDDKTEILFLPYITEDNRKPLKEYLEGRNSFKKLIVCAHNDIKDFQMGGFISKTGFKVSEIEENCDLYLNGHLHNCGWVSKKICNVGNLTGQNFSEDAFKYNHHVAILNTDTLEMTFYENPYAFNFYKIEINEPKDFKVFDNLKSNAIVSIRCRESLHNELLEELKKHNNIIEHKIIIYRETTTSGEVISFNTNADHLEMFKDFILNREDVGSTSIVEEELMEVCK